MPPGCIAIEGTFSIVWTGTYAVVENDGDSLQFAGVIQAEHIYGVTPFAVPPNPPPAGSAFANPTGTYADKNCTTPSGSSTAISVTGSAQGGPDLNGVSVSCTYTSGKIQRVGNEWSVTLIGTCTLSRPAIPGPVPLPALTVSSPAMEVRQGALGLCTPAPPAFPPTSCPSESNTYTVTNPI